jgi:hypothetical protein
VLGAAARNRSLPVPLVRTISVTVAVVALQQCGSAGSSTNLCGANERFPAAVAETDDEL